MHGKSTAVLEMDYRIVDFLTLCETPYSNGKSVYEEKIVMQLSFENVALYLALLDID